MTGIDQRELLQGGPTVVLDEARRTALGALPTPVGGRY